MPKSGTTRGSQDSISWLVIISVRLSLYITAGLTGSSPSILSLASTVVRVKVASVMVGAGFIDLVGWTSRCLVLELLRLWMLGDWSLSFAVQRQCPLW